MQIALALVVVFAAGYAGDRLARLVRLSPVVGQMMFGLIPGPLVLGAVAPSTFEWLFQATNKAIITHLGSLTAGVLLFLGAALHHAQPTDRRRDGRLLVVGNLVGAAVAAALAIPALSAVAEIYFTPEQAAFLVIMFAVCALPVMFRIIDENDLGGTRVARRAILVGIVCDIIAWTALAAAGVARGPDPARGLIELAGAGLVVVVFVSLWRTGRLRVTSDGKVAIALTALVCAAGGVGLAAASHMDPLVGALLGGLLFRCVAPRRANVTDALEAAGRTNARALPLFFASAGLSVEVSGGIAQLTVIATIATILAVGARVGGTLGVARWISGDRIEVRALCALLSARGATELAVLQAGQRLDLIPPALYPAAVIMAIATTALAGIAVRWYACRMAPVGDTAAGRVGAALG